MHGKCFKGKNFRDFFDIPVKISKPNNYNNIIIPKYAN